VTDIAVYVEGGGSSKEQKAELRRGFDALFAVQKARASSRRLSLIFICCGGRQEAYEAFRNAMQVNRQRINALLVDSETAIAAVPADAALDGPVRVAHLRKRARAGRRLGLAGRLGWADSPDGAMHGSVARRGPRCA